MFACDTTQRLCKEKTWAPTHPVCPEDGPPDTLSRVSLSLSTAPSWWGQGPEQLPVQWLQAPVESVALSWGGKLAQQTSIRGQRAWQALRNLEIQWLLRDPVLQRKALWTKGEVRKLNLDIEKRSRARTRGSARGAWLERKELSWVRSSSSSLSQTLWRKRKKQF